MTTSPDQRPRQLQEILNEQSNLRMKVTATLWLLHVPYQRRLRGWRERTEDDRKRTALDAPQMCFSPKEYWITFDILSYCPHTYHFKATHNSTPQSLCVNSVNNPIYYSFREQSHERRELQMCGGMLHKGHRSGPEKCCVLLQQVLQRSASVGKTNQFELAVMPCCQLN